MVVTLKQRLVDLTNAIVEKFNILDSKKISTNETLYFDELTTHLESNIGNATQRFIWNGGAQEFILVDNPSNIFLVTVDEDVLYDNLLHYSIDVEQKKLTVLKTLLPGQQVTINYNFIIRK